MFTKFRKELKMKICSIDGCNNECDKGRRYCRKHYLERISK